MSRGTLALLTGLMLITGCEHGGSQMAQPRRPAGMAQSPGLNQQYGKAVAPQSEVANRSTTAPITQTRATAPLSGNAPVVSTFAPAAPTAPSNPTPIATSPTPSWPTPGKASAEGPELPTMRETRYHGFEMPNQP